MRNLTKALTAVLLLIPASGYSLGIGDIKLHSALNQNLNAEIALVVSANEDVSDIKVTLAPAEKFDEAGVPWSYFLPKIKFKLEVKPNSSVVIKVTSNEALKEPFLDLLIQVTWPKGSLYREFIVLIDPPQSYLQPKTDKIDALGDEEANKKSVATKLKLRPPREHKIAKKTEVFLVDQKSLSKLANANQDFHVQLKKMQEQLATMEKLLTIKDQKLALLHKQLEGKAAPDKTIHILIKAAAAEKKTLEDKAAADKAASDKAIADAKTAAVKKALEDKAKAEKAFADEAAADKAAAEAKAEAEKALEDKAEYTQVIKKLSYRNIVFNSPESMVIDETATIHLVLGQKSIEKLKKVITESGTKEGYRVKAYGLMKAELSSSSDSFNISPNEEAKYVDMDDPDAITEWNWYVTAKMKGVNHLKLTLSVIVEVNNILSPPVVIKTFNKDIIVKVTLPQKTKLFFSDNWQLMTLGIGVMLIIVLIRYSNKKTSGVEITNLTIHGDNQQFADNINNQNKNINSTNYVEGNVSGGNIAGRDKK